MDKSEVGMVAQRVNKPLIKTLKSPTLKCLGGSRIPQLWTQLPVNASWEAGVKA